MMGSGCCPLSIEKGWEGSDRDGGGCSDLLTDASPNPGSRPSSPTCLLKRGVGSGSGPAERRTQPGEGTLGPGAVGPLWELPPTSGGSSGLWSQTTWIYILITFSCKTLGKSLKFSRPQSHHLEKWGAHSVHPTGVAGR